MYNSFRFKWIKNNFENNYNFLEKCVSFLEIHIFHKNYFHSSLKLIYKYNLYVLDLFQTHILIFLANIHIITNIIFAIKNTQFYMIILNHTDFRNYKTHVSFSHIGLKILIVFVWSIYLQIAFKHWRNINVLISINKHFIFYGKWFICGRPLPN